jgi:hypothetical protein
MIKVAISVCTVLCQPMSNIIMFNHNMHVLICVATLLQFWPIRDLPLKCTLHVLYDFTV